MNVNFSSYMNAVSTTQWSNFTRALNSSIAPWSGVILATSVTALIGLGLYRWSQTNSDSKLNAAKDDQFEKIKEKVSRAYGYVFGGFSLTAVSAVAAHISGLSQHILQNSYYISIPITLASFASLFATLWTDKDNSKTKHVAWGIFNVTMGLMLSPLGYLNQKIVAQAAAISLGLGGTLTFIAYKAPDKRFLAWEGPLMAVLTSMSIASTIALFFPGSAFAYGADRASLYGGLIVFTGLLMSSTQRLLTEAEQQSDKEFDPINSSMNIYLDGLNIFIRILRIMLENQKKEEKA